MTEHDEAQVPEQEESQAPAKLSSGWLLFIIGVVAGMLVGWGAWQPMLYAKKTQPFSFNHKAHADTAGMECEECHQFREDGSFSGAPRVAACLDCHTWSDRQNDENQAETAFLEEFVTEDDELKKPLEWYIYSKQPDCVFFSHIAHVQMGEIKCEECHGDHGQTSKLRPYYVNWITGYPRDVYKKMKMTDCADCHTRRDKPENNACFVCHK